MNCFFVITQSVYTYVKYRLCSVGPSPLCPPTEKKMVHMSHLYESFVLVAGFASCYHPELTGLLLPSFHYPTPHEHTCNTGTCCSNTLELRGGDEECGGRVCGQAVTGGHRQAATKAASKCHHMHVYICVCVCVCALDVRCPISVYSHTLLPACSIAI